MRTDARRSAKYSSKVRGMVLPGQRENFSAKIGRQVEIEQIVNRIAGSTINRVYYIIFGKEAEKIIKKHKGGTLRTEMEILEAKWTARGLTETTLDSIKRALNYTVPVINTFRFDISALDGTDVLV